MQLVNLSVICQVILLNFVTNSECQTIRDVSSASLEALPALDASKLLIRRGHVQEVQDRDDDSRWHSWINIPSVKLLTLHPIVVWDRLWH